MKSYHEVTKGGIKTVDQLFEAMRAAAEDEDGGRELESRFLDWLDAIDRIQEAKP